MKRESKLLLSKSCDSLLLSIELFNRPNDRGRVSSTLIFLDHAFEMLLKASILHRNGKIRDKGATQTIGFDACVRRCLSDGTLKILSSEQALTLQIINGLRDAAQHHLLDISEGQFYIHVQSGITLFRDILKHVFDQNLIAYLPSRVLPVSTTPPTDISTLFDVEIKEIKRLLMPGSRRRIEAEAKLRPLAILNSTIEGKKGQPSSSELNKVEKDLAKGRDWKDVFQGVASIDITPDGTGPSLALRLSKKEGMPIQLVPEGTPGASIVAVKRVNELSFYSMGAKQLAKKMNLTMPKLLAIVDYTQLRDDQECYKEFKIGGIQHKQYSQKVITKINTLVQKESADDIWQKMKSRKTNNKNNTLGVGRKS